MAWQTHESSISWRAASARGDFADDADLAELIDLFLADLPGLGRAIEQALESDDPVRLTELSRVVGRAARGYGFAGVAAAAAGVERSIVTGDPPGRFRGRALKLIQQMRRTAQAEDER